MLFSLLLTLAPSVPIQDDPLAPIPGDRDARLDPGLREELEAWSAEGADWRSEQRAAEIAQQLERLGRAVLQSSVANAELFRAVCTADARAAGAPSPVEQPRAALRTGAFEVLDLGRAGLPAGASNVDELFAALAAGRAAHFGDARAVRVKFKVDAIEEAGDALRAGVRVEVSSARAELDLYWDTTWALPADGQPLLASIECVEHVQVRRPGDAPLLTEAGHAIFGGDVYERQLLPGLESWRARLDADLGVGMLGHHGLAVADFDGDGLEDVYLCQPGGLPNRLYRHTADGRAEEIAAQAGVDFYEASTAALFLHLDDDGRRDLVVATGGELLFLKNARTRFVLAARRDAPHTTSLAAADADGDGDLDLYACAYLSPYEGLGTPLPYHDANNGARNILFLNGGGYQFTDATAAAGLDVNNRRFSFAAAWEDYDNDGDQDLYVANDFGRNNLYRNDGTGFVDVAAELGVEDLSAGMGVTWADVNRDGWMDLYVSNMFSAAGGRVAYQSRFRSDADDEERGEFKRHARGNSLFLNRAGERFEDASEASGAGMGRWAWGALFADLDDDGHQDLLVPNGFVTGERADDL